MRATVTATNTSIYDQCFVLTLFDNNYTKVLEQCLFSGNIIILYGQYLSPSAFDMAIAQWYERNPSKRVGFDYAKARLNVAYPVCATTTTVPRANLVPIEGVRLLAPEQVDMDEDALLFRAAARQSNFHVSLAAEGYMVVNGEVVEIC